ncbi:hypothetical protein UFOVP716_4 [uncultured Caudovirales phage]|uniref:Uncharacterized protein n=1 Tax=uncultured Caudovirales phage TaxID=2100421 RepID=A0A6J5NL66_9CAUD|nr:hypothetical protein UFOVP716_4 [uncultured Caudovirales phage]
MQQNITIKYIDGTEETFMVRPPDYARWEMATKKVISQFGGMYDILFVAHSAMKREAGGKPTKPLDIWMESVLDLEVGAEDPKVTPGEA